MLRMDEVNKIRKKFFAKGQSRCQIAKEARRSWDTVNRIVRMDRSDLEKRGKRSSRKKTVMTDHVIQSIKDLLDYEEAINVKKKQRYTAYKIYTELSERGIYHGSRRRMEEMVSQLKAERGKVKQPAFLPLYFPLGSALQFDHGEVEVEVNGKRVKGYLFVASVPGQSLRYSQVFPTKASEAWGEFHERTFRFFGGCFCRSIYDNDSVLIKKIIGEERKQTNFSLSLEEHYGFESHFCNVGAGNEKGAVENGVGYCRRRFFPGLPSFESWSSLNDWLSSCCSKEIEQGSHYKTKEKLSDIFASLKIKLTPIPPKKSWCRWLECRVDKCQLVTVDKHQYSVPEKFVGSKVRVALTCDKVEIAKEGEIIAVHDRQYEQEDSLKLDHYLDQLQRKPGAFSYAKVSNQVHFDPKMIEMKNRLTDKYGNRKANKQFVNLLLLERKWHRKEVIEGVKKALDLGAIDVSAVENIIRQKELSFSKRATNFECLLPIASVKWDFNLSAYRELCQEAPL
jgi:transposase